MAVLPFSSIFEGRLVLYKGIRKAQNGWHEAVGGTVIAGVWRSFAGLNADQGGISFQAKLQLSVD